MKKILLNFLFVFTLSMTINEQEQLNINTSKSNIKWSCDYAFYFGGHFGEVKFKDGYFIKTLGKITSGEFTINLNSIVTQDMDNEKANQSLTDHLKNEDFFNVNQYPTAKLSITKTKYHNDTQLKVYANLTIKGVTKPISFQAEIDYEKKLMTTKFKIDRTLWNIIYGSKSNTSEKAKNSIISDAIGFEVSFGL